MLKVQVGPVLAYTTFSDIRGQPLYILGCSLLVPVSGLFSLPQELGRIHITGWARMLRAALMGGDGRAGR